MGNTKCIFCGSDVKIMDSLAYPGVSRKFQCPVCGIYEFISDHKKNFEKYRNEFSFYLYYYNKLIKHDNSYKILLVSNIDENKNYEEQGYKLIDFSYVSSFYPKTLTKKLDYLLYGLNKKIGRLDNVVSISIEELSSIFVIEKKLLVKT